MFFDYGKSLMFKKVMVFSHLLALSAGISVSAYASKPMTEKNLTEATKAYEATNVKTLKKLHNAGNLFASHMLVRCYELADTCQLNKDVNKAQQYKDTYDLSEMMTVLLSLEARGSQAATNWLANYYRDTNTTEGRQTAYDYFLKNADQNNAYAMYQLGNYFYQGLTPVMQSYEQAHTWYKKAAELNNVNAMRQLQVMYEKGQGVSVSARTAAQWQEKADKEAKLQTLTSSTKGLPSLNGQNTIVTTFFGTNRNVNKTSNPKRMFGHQVSALTYGSVKVSIPKDHRVGEIESPFLWMKPDPSKHVMFPENAIKLMQPADFYKTLSKEIAKSPRKKALVFIHGFNTSFENAAKRTAQMSYDLKFEGAPIFYSWPARKTIIPSLGNYRINEKNIKQSIPFVTSFLEGVLKKTDAEDVYLIAHSMGNRALIQSMVDILQKNPKINKRIKEMILAAPDVDANVFKRDIAPALSAGLKKPITLYTSSNDIALLLSEQVNGAPRIGNANNSVVIYGIENVDVSQVDSSFLGHSYYGENTSVISDIVCLIHKEMRAEERKYLKHKTLTSGLQWLFEGKQQEATPKKISINNACKKRIVRKQS